MALNQFSGVVGMLSYTANIFADAGSSLEPNIATIVIGIMQLVANVFATNLVDRAGRKLLIALSSMAMALGLAVLGVYMNLKSWDVDVTAFSWLPLVSFSFVVFVSQIGVLSLPFIVSLFLHINTENSENHKVDKFHHINDPLPKNLGPRRNNARTHQGWLCVFLHVVAVDILVHHNQVSADVNGIAWISSLHVLICRHMHCWSRIRCHSNAGNQMQNS